MSDNILDSITNYIIKNYSCHTIILLAMRNKKLGKTERLAKAMSVLHERNIISSPVKLTTTRKPTTVYQVNPMVLPGRLN